MRTAVVVTDSNVDRLYGDKFIRSIEGEYARVERIVFPAGEKSKTLETYAELVRGFAALELTRADLAIALGGGVVGDLTGFAAATYMRGIDFIQVPTTLLAMVDSSIGGKTGVDIPEGKNLVGAFHLPKKIIRDAKFLETLPEKELKNGLAEMIKTAVLFDPEMFADLERLASLDSPERLAPLANLVDRTASWKQKIVDEDFKEGGKRKLLNLGHTFGHAIEKATKNSYNHGQAVAIGMIMAFCAAERLGICAAGESERVKRLCKKYGLPTQNPCSPEELLDAMLSDKKRAGARITLVLPRSFGDTILYKTDVSALTEIISAAMD
jgi:3-dehydroquinate synthase